MIRSYTIRRRLFQTIKKDHRSTTISATRSMCASARQTWKEEVLAAPQGGAMIPDNVSIRQRRIISRSKQRGLLELDILMGGWAAKNVPKMHDDSSISKVEQLLEEDTPDVLKWVLGQEIPPSQYQNEIMQSIQAYASGDGHVNDR